MTTPTPVRPTVDLDRDGVQHGHLELPWSRDDSAWGVLKVPISVVRNGDGPTALLTGANHGDEYEGTIALLDLAASLDARAVEGRVIIVPAMNYPAFRAGRRTSPIDGGNMNRSFPGRPDGTLTEKIADYFEQHLLPIADYVVDLHSGGRTLEFVPFAAAHRLPEPDHEARCMAAMHAFAAPYSVVMMELDPVGLYDSAAEALGKTFVTTELGGGGSASARTVAVARRGVSNVLRHAGIVRGAPEPAPSVALDMARPECFVRCERDGLLEMRRDLGKRVEAGEVIARVHATDRTGEAPAEYRARLSGMVAGRHFPGLIQTGDCLCVVAALES